MGIIKKDCPQKYDCSLLGCWSAWLEAHRYETDRSRYFEVRLSRGILFYCMIFIRQVCRLPLLWLMNCSVRDMNLLLLRNCCLHSCFLLLNVLRLDTVHKETCKVICQSPPWIVRDGQDNEYGFIWLYERNSAKGITACVAYASKKHLMKLLVKSISSGKNTMLYRAVRQISLAPLFFYGPPGTGKTTLAMVIANTTSSEFTQLNATVAGKKDMEDVVKRAKDLRECTDAGLFFLLMRFIVLIKDSRIICCHL